MSRSSFIPSAPTSSSRPRNGETQYAPISAARIAWAGENTSVTLVRIPSAASRLPASRPAGVIGTLTTAFGAMPASRSPSSYIGAASGSVVSSEMSPSTSARISFQTASGSPPSLTTSEGLVVTPPSTPHRLISRISSMLAVSRNSLMPSSPAVRAVCALRDPRGRAVHHEIQHGRDRLIEAVVRDDRHAVRQCLALDVPLQLPDVAEVVRVALRRPDPRLPGREVVQVPALLLHLDDQRNGHDARRRGRRDRRTPGRRGPPRSRCSSRRRTLA